MSDLISRSALIKAIKKQSQRYCDCKGCDGKGNIIRVSDVMEILDEQPTVCDIECQINQLAKEYEQTIDVAELVEKFGQEKAQSNNGWIPCSERLPERNKTVLCWAKSTARGGDTCFVGSCSNGCWFLQSSIGTLSYPTQYVVLAWRLLPEPYKGGIT